VSNNTVHVFAKTVCGLFS